MKLKKKGISFALCLLLFSTIGCDNEKEQNSIKPVYDFRDEKHQDFYSQLRRSLAEKDENGKIPPKKSKQLNDTNFSFNYDHEKVEKLLDLSNVPKTVRGRIVITRIKPDGNVKKTPNHFKDKKSIVDFFKNRKSVPIKYYDCPPEWEIDSLICLTEEDYPKPRYFFVPNTSKKFDYINQDISMFCSPPLVKYHECKLLNNTDYPYNLDIWVKFDNPNNFFYVIQYIDTYIFNATGEHIWQTSLKQK